MPSAVTPAVVTPALATAALASEAPVIEVPSSGEDGAASPDPADVLTAWLRVITAPLGLGEERTQWLAAVAVIAEAGEDGVTAGEVRDAVSAASDDEDGDERADRWLDEWVLFGALVRSGVLPAGGLPPGAYPAGGLALDDLLAGGRFEITPLGRLLTDSVTATLGPGPDDNAAATVERLGALPVGVAISYAAGWLGARTPVTAAGELIDFAASAAPRERATAIDLAAELGPDAAPAWRERAQLPGYGAYVREWLADQGEEVPDFPGDDAWIAAETFSLALAEAPAWLGDGKVAWAIEEVFDGDDPVTVLAASGHLDAPRLIKLVEQMKGLFP